MKVALICSLVNLAGKGAILISKSSWLVSGRTASFMGQVRNGKHLVTFIKEFGPTACCKDKVSTNLGMEVTKEIL